MSRPLSVLMVEDSADDAELLLRELRRQGFSPTHSRVETGDALQAALEGRPWDIVISDNNMPGFSGAAALRIVRQVSPDVPFVFVSGTLSEEHAVEAMRAGANDFVTKARLHRLVPVVERELVEAEHRADQRRTAAALEEAQERLRQSQKLEAVGRLAGGVAHDFNNLLGAILAYTNLVLRDLAPDDAHRDDLQEIKNATAMAAGLTQQLVAFSRQQVLGRDVLNLRHVVRNNLALLRRLMGDGIDVTTAFDTHVWNVKGDRSQLEQVIVNLALNARDAMPGGGTLHIGVSNTVVPTAGLFRMPPRPGRYVRLDVRDTGVGIAADVLPKIFDPFFTTKELGKGTGLGLATVYGIVEQSDGSVFVESQPDEGTVFSIFLPQTAEPLEPVDATTAS